MLDVMRLICAFVFAGIVGVFAVWAILRLRPVRRLPGDFDFDFYKRQEPK
ncbi:hypothetical protein JCM15519_20350 [Fundidesulfovibrio butyratiphilus]